jgi:hypothetical protein
MNKTFNSISERIIAKNPHLKYKEIQSYAKIYPDFVKIIKYKRSIIVDNFGTSSNGLANEENSEERDYLEKSINRTKTKISDYVLCNNFSHFATFTFSPEKVKDRHDFVEMSSLLKNWLKTEQQNHERNHGFKFKYLIVPERHKDGAWHFHALLENYQNACADFYSSKNPFITVSEIKTAKRFAYRKYLVRYTLGRSEIAPIRDKTKMANYIKKYITKELITEPNAKRFWASRNLAKPEIIENLVSTNTKIPEKFKTQTHDYHEIFEIPTDSDYFQFLKVTFKVDLHYRRLEKILRL